MTTNTEEAVELCKFLGRSQAFGLVANRCSAAQAQCLKQMKDNGAYKALGLTWEDFCEQQIGISRVTADKLIHELDELGAAYFQLGEIMRISPALFRRLPVSEEGLEFEGTKIPIAPENAPRIIEAVRALRPARREPPPPPLAGERIDALRNLLQTAVSEADELCFGPLEEVHRQVLRDLLLEAAGRLRSAGQGMPER